MGNWVSHTPEYIFWQHPSVHLTLELRWQCPQWGANNWTGPFCDALV
jgi:hypothetical protein